MILTFPVVYNDQVRVGRLWFTVGVLHHLFNGRHRGATIMADPAELFAVVLPAAAAAMIALLIILIVIGVLCCICRRRREERENVDCIQMASIQMASAQPPTTAAGGAMSVTVGGFQLPDQQAADLPHNGKFIVVSELCSQGFFNRSGRRQS